MLIELFYPISAERAYYLVVLLSHVLLAVLSVLSRQKKGQLQWLERARKANLTAETSMLMHTCQEHQNISPVNSQKTCHEQLIRETG